MFSLNHTLSPRVKELGFHLGPFQIAERSCVRTRHSSPARKARGRPAPGLSCPGVPLSVFIRRNGLTVRQPPQQLLEAGKSSIHKHCPRAGVWWSDSGPIQTMGLEAASDDCWATRGHALGFRFWKNNAHVGSQVKGLSSTPTCWTVPPCGRWDNGCRMAGFLCCFFAQLCGLEPKSVPRTGLHQPWRSQGKGGVGSFLLNGSTLGAEPRWKSRWFGKVHRWALFYFNR